MNIAARSILSDLDAELSKEVPLLQPSTKRPDEGQVADYHRRQAHNCLQRIADAKRRLKADVATFAAARKAEKDRHNAEMLAISEAEAFAKERTAEGIAKDERWSKYNRAAIDALAE